MVNPLSCLTLKQKSGDETIHADGNTLGYSLLDFWRWSASDLISNATRGVLAEFLIATALSIPLDCVRDEWGAYDLTTPTGIKIEVKSAAYIQSWEQRKLSTILQPFCLEFRRRWPGALRRMCKRKSHGAGRMYMSLRCLLIRISRQLTR